MLRAIETTATVNSKHQIVLHEDLPSNAPSHVRVIVLFDELDADISDKEWQKAVSSNEVFDFLKDASEDIYTLADGRPVTHEQ